MDRVVAQARLNDFRGQFQAAVDAAIDAPTRIEMPERAEPGVLGLSRLSGPPGLLGLFGDDAGLDEGWQELASVKHVPI